MPYKIVDGELVKETDKNYISLASPKRELFDALKAQVKRAEAAEARAAQLETDNDEMQSYINEIRVALHTEKDELTIDAVRRVMSERDAIRADMIQCVSDGRKMATDLYHMQNQLSDLRRQLEQAQQACAYWLTDGRFLVANSPEYQKAIDMLAINTP